MKDVFLDSEETSRGREEEKQDSHITSTELVLSFFVFYSKLQMS